MLCRTGSSGPGRCAPSLASDVPALLIVPTPQIGNDSVTGTVQAPLWSYKLGLENGWMPKDPREAVGKCAVVRYWESWSSQRVQNSTRRSDDVEKDAQVVVKAMMVEDLSFCELVKFL